MPSLPELGWQAAVSPGDLPLGNLVFCGHTLADIQESI